MDRKLLFAFAASAALGIFLWRSPALYPFKLLVVLMHESSHAFGALLCGGSVVSISVSPDEGGLTRSMLVPSVWRQVVVSSAGYVGSMVAGCALILAAARARTARWPLVLMAFWTACVALLWVRDAFTLLFTAGMSVLLFLAARFAPEILRRALLVFIATFSALYALFDIRDDLLHLSTGETDAVILSRVTYVPAIVWGVLWGVAAVVLLYFTLRAALRAGPARPEDQLPARAEARRG